MSDRPAVHRRCRQTARVCKTEHDFVVWCETQPSTWPSMSPPTGVHTLVWFSPTLTQSCPVWPIASGRSDGRSLPRLGCRSPWSWPGALSLSRVFHFEGSQLPCCEQPRVKAHVEGVLMHFSNNTGAWKWLLQPSWAFQWLRPQLMAWLQPHERPWVRTTQLSLL